MSKGDACDKVWMRPFMDLNKDLFPDFENNTPTKEQPTYHTQVRWKVRRSTDHHMTLNASPWYLTLNASPGYLRARHLTTPALR